MNQDINDIPEIDESPKSQRCDSNAISTTQAKRPTSVTVISWLLIVLSVIGAVVMLGTAVAIEFDAQFMPLVIAGIVASIIQIVMGVGMLNGQNWARVLFLWLTPISIIVGFFSGRVSPGSVVKIIWYIIFAVYLNKEHVVGYFRGASEGSI